MNKQHDSDPITNSEAGAKRIAHWLASYQHQPYPEITALTSQQITTSASHAALLASTLFEPIGLYTFTRLTSVLRDKEGEITITGQCEDVVAATELLETVIATADQHWRELQLSPEFEFFDTLQVLARRKPTYKEFFYSVREQITTHSYTRLMHMTPMQRHSAAQRRRELCAMQ